MRCGLLLRSLPVCAEDGGGPAPQVGVDVGGPEEKAGGLVEDVEGADAEVSNNGLDLIVSTWNSSGGPDSG